MTMPPLPPPVFAIATSVPMIAYSSAQMQEIREYAAQVTAERDALRKQLAGKTGYVLDDADRELCAIINAAICGSVQCDLDDSTIREALELLVQLTIPETKP